MVSFIKSNRPGRPAKRPARTSVSFSSAELEELGRLLAVGQSVLQKRAAVSPRLKAAMTRVGIPVPPGL